MKNSLYNQIMNDAHQVNIQMGEQKEKTLVCEKHGEYQGWITEIARKDIPTICPDCLEEEIVSERIEREKKQRLSAAEARIKKIFNRSSFPKLFSNIKFEDYKPCCPKAEVTLTRMKKYAENFANVREVGSSIVLLGGTGTGKTMMAAAIGNTIMKKGYTVLYMTCPQAISMIKRSWAKNNEISQDEYLEKMTKPDLLILDEVPKGCNSKTDWELVHEIMNRRYMDAKPTISISTLPEAKLKKLLTEEILRRMYYKGKIIHFNWNRFKEIGLLW